VTTRINLKSGFRIPKPNVKPDVKIKFKDFSSTFKDHIYDVQGELH